MKKFVKKLIYVMSWPLAFLWNAKVSAFFNALRDSVYSCIVSHRLKGAEGLNVYGRPVMISGAEHIRVGKNVTICRLARIDAVTFYPNTGQIFTPDFEIGDNAVIQVSCHIGCINKVRIGKYTTIAARTLVTDHTHGTVEEDNLELPPSHRKLYSKGPVIIGDYVMIGEGCAIMPGVTIGDHAVIRANSVVTKDIPPYSVACGNPAKVIKCMKNE